MQTTPFQHRLQRTLAALLAAALLAPAAPAQASELVKLARLVITGKRLTAERAPELEQQRVATLPRVVIEGRCSDDGLQLALHRRALPRAL